MRVSVVVPPPAWPADPGHCEAIETLLVMAEAEYRWGDSGRARGLLDGVEQIVGELPEQYRRMRLRCRDGATPGPGD